LVLPVTELRSFPMSRHPLRAVLLATAWLLLAAPAGAATISLTSIANGSTNFFDDVGAVGSVGQSSTSTLINGALGFQTRYAAVVGADAGGAGAASFTQNFTGTFTITFAVTETAGVAWTAAVDVLRNGARTIITDGAGSAQVTLNALTVTHAGAGSLVGSLNLAGLGTMSSGADLNQGFNQTSSATLTGVGTGAAQVMSLTFTVTASARTVVQGNQGDEGALRMGMDSGLTSFTADSYPGTTFPRTLANDGIFVSAAVPEPAAEALLAVGLIGLAWFDYRRRP
jgi:hypothetical protein